MRARRWLPPWMILIWVTVSASAVAKDRLLIMCPESESAEEVISVIQQETGEHFEIRREIVPARPTRASYENLERVLSNYDPHILLLLNNAAVYDYKRYQINHRQEGPFPPAVVCMASFVGSEIEGMSNTTGISYEVPAMKSFNFVRDTINRPVRRIGVIFRARFRDFINNQHQLAEQESFTLVPYEIDSNERNMGRAVRRGLRQLTGRQDVDAIWVLNDNKLVDAQLTADVWIPRLRNFHKPVVVGVESLIRVPGFGNFAVLPDHSNLAYQAASLLIDIQDNNWQVINEGVDEPYSSEKYLRLDFAQEYLDLDEEKLEEIDHIVD